jgi:hypothetical protein
VLTGFEGGERHRAQTGLEVKVALGLRTRLTGGQTGNLFGVSEPTLDVEPRFVITGNGQGVQVSGGTQEHSLPVACGGDHEPNAEVALERARVEHLMREHESILFGLNFVKPREGVPVHLAVIGVGTAWTGALQSLVEIAEMGVEAQWANWLKPQGTDTPEAFLCAVITIGDDVASVVQMMLRYHPGQWLQIDINSCGLGVGRLVCWWCLFGTEPVSGVVGEVEPSPSRDFHAFCCAAMTTVPEGVKAIGLLPTFGDKTGINDSGLCMFRRDHVEDRRLGEGDKVDIAGVPTC